MPPNTLVDARHMPSSRESVRATLRRNVLRLLAESGSPPEVGEGATQRVLQHTELSTEHSVEQEDILRGPDARRTWSDAWGLSVR